MNRAEFTADWAGRTFNWCARGDPVCQRGLDGDLSVHAGYPSYVPDAAQQVLGRVRAVIPVPIGGSLDAPP